MHRIAMGALVAASLVLVTPLTATASTGPTAKPVVSFRVDERSPEVGDPVVAKGVVTHVPQSTSVQIQRRTRSGWHRIAAGSTAVGGAYTVTFTASGLAKEPLRAVVGAAGRHGAAVSPTRTITVFDWFPLDDVPLSSRTGSVQAGATAVLGTTEDDVVVFAPQADSLRPTATWELDRACTDFRSNVVLDETTPGTDTLRVLVDGVQKATGTVRKVTGIAADLHGARFLKLETDGVAGVANQRAAWTSADVLCTVDPADL